MKVLLINSVCGIRSTGRICTDIAEKMMGQGHEVKIAYGREQVPEQYKKLAIRIGNETTVKINALSCRVFDNDGFAAREQTKKFLKWAEEYNPDLLWLHNLHGYYINVELLFSWIKARPQMKVKWTLHDCWTFTGHCACFDMVNCMQWRDNECSRCMRKKTYPSSYLFNFAGEHFYKKREVFCGVKDMTLITPSKWLAGLVKKSFLKNYEVQVIHNTIDLESFRPTISQFRAKYQLEDKKVILGVASAWGKGKGLYDFIKLTALLDDTYQIVLVGLTKKQLKRMPETILGIHRTDSKKELAEIYSTADVFVNLTYSDNYPTVNLEARACGAKIITYNSGGSPESAGLDAIVVPKGDLQAVVKEIKTLCEGKKEYSN